MLMDEVMSSTARTGTTDGFWTAPFPQCPAFSQRQVLDPLGIRKSRGNGLGGLRLTQERTGRDLMTIISVFLLSVGRDGPRSPHWLLAPSPVVRILIWDSVAMGGRGKRCRPRLPTARGKRIKINHPRSRRRVVCLSIKPAELFFRPAFLSRFCLDEGKENALRAPPRFFPADD